MKYARLQQPSTLDSYDHRILILEHLLQERRCRLKFV